MQASSSFVPPQAALDLALSSADDVSRDRYLEAGRQLVPVDDREVLWGPSWEYDQGLTYEQVDQLTVELQSTAIIAEEDFPVPQVAAVHYCDLLSPYRALEWIYVASVVHG